MSSIRVHPVNELVGDFCRAVPVLLLVTCGCAAHAWS